MQESLWLYILRECSRIVVQLLGISTPDCFDLLHVVINFLPSTDVVIPVQFMYSAAAI